MVENSAPEGYTKDTTPILFSVGVKADGTLEVTGASAEKVGDGWTIKVTNQPKTVKIQVFKHGGVNGNGEPIPLAGATFELYEGDTKIEGGISDAKGYLPVWEVTPEKTYTLKETKAPDGYLVVNPEQTFYVDKNGKALIDGKVISTNENGVNVISVMNNPGVPLPSTGGPGAYLYTITGGGVMLLAGAVLLARRKRERA